MTEATSDTLESSTVLGGRYVLLGLLGAGGMGAVYRALDKELDEMVALKILRRDLVEAPGMLDRFRREVKLARKISHPNVVRVFDLGEHEDTRFLTMELVDGASLAQLIADRGAVSPARAKEIGAALCGRHRRGARGRRAAPRSQARERARRARRARGDRGLRHRARRG